MNANFVDDKTIGDHERVLRRISKSDVIMDPNLQRKRPSSACFLQGDGPDSPVSVYIASEVESEAAVLAGYPDFFLVSLTVRYLRQLGLGIARDPSSGGAGHAVIIGRKTHGMQSKLAKAATWVQPYSPPQ